MPKIMNQEEQKRALKDITSTLKDLSRINEFLAAVNPNGTFSVDFLASDNARYSATLFVQNKEDIDRFVRDYKKKKCEEIIQLAEKYHIELDPEDDEIMKDF